MNQLTGQVIGAAIEVQQILGPGLLESAYSGALAHEFTLRKLRFEREAPIPAHYKGVAVGPGFRADFIVEKQLVLELKTVEALAAIHRAQLLSYLRLSALRLGLLINFHEAPVSRAIHRVVNNLPTQ